MRYNRPYKSYKPFPTLHTLILQTLPYSTYPWGSQGLRNLNHLEKKTDTYFFLKKRRKRKTQRKDSQEILMFVVRANLVGQKKENKLTKILYHKKILDLSHAIRFKKPDMRPVPVLSDYLVKLVIPASRAILKPVVIYRFVSLLQTPRTSRLPIVFLLRGSQLSFTEHVYFNLKS